MRVCRNAKFPHALMSWVGMCKMQDAEMDKQPGSWHIMTQRLNSIYYTF